MPFNASIAAGLSWRPDEPRGRWLEMRRGFECRQRLMSSLSLSEPRHLPILGAQKMPRIPHIFARFDDTREDFGAGARQVECYAC